MNGNIRGALNQYSQVAVQSGISAGSPHRLIQMLMDGALERIATAKGHMERGEVAAKGEQISWAISIVEGLRVSLDHKPAVTCPAIWMRSTTIWNDA
jgi:flagellar protein FliS